MKIRLPGIIFFLLIGCSRNDAIREDHELPVITILSPINGQTITSGQKLNIAGNITDNDFISQVHIHVYNSNTSQLLMDIHINPGSNMENFQNNDLTATSGINYKIEIVAIDRAVNEARVIIEVACL